MNRNLFLSSLSLALFMTIGLFSYSCTQDDVSQEVFAEDSEIDFRGPGDRGENQCFSFVYPLTLVFPDGTEVEVASKEEVKPAIRAYKESHPDARRIRPKFAFPYDVTLADGTTLTIENREGMHQLIRECRANRPDSLKRKRCYKIVYPVTVAFPDGTSTSVNSAEEYHLALREWKANNPDADRRPHLAFPYTVLLKNGNELIIENLEDQHNLNKRCRKVKRHHRRRHRINREG